MVDSWTSSISLTREFVRNGEIWPRHIESICILSWFLDDSVLQPKLRLSRTQGKEARSWPPRGHCLNSGSKWCFSSHSPHPVRYQVLIYFPFKQISLVSHKLVPDKHLPSSLRAAAEINPFTTSAQKISRDPYFHHFRCEFLHLNTRPSHIWLQVTCLTWFPLCLSGASWSFHHVPRCQPVPLYLGSWRAIPLPSSLCLSKPHSFFKDTSFCSECLQHL